MSKRTFSFENNMDVPVARASNESVASKVQNYEQVTLKTNEEKHSEDNLSKTEVSKLDVPKTSSETSDSETKTVVKNSKGIIAVVIILSILLVCGVIALVFLCNEINNYQSTIDSLTSEKNNLNNRIVRLESDLSLARTARDNYKNQVSTLQTDNAALKKKVSDLSTGVFDAICTFNPGYYYSDFHASTDIVVVKKGETKTVDITLTHVYSRCSWEWSDSSVCDSDYGEWDDNMSFPLKIKAKKTGTCVFTFSNTYNKETFKVLVVVTD